MFTPKQKCTDSNKKLFNWPFTLEEACWVPWGKVFEDKVFRYVTRFEVIVQTQVSVLPLISKYRQADWK